MTNHIRLLTVFVACVGLLGLSGCLGGNSDVASVTGTVKVDGEPIGDATVTFMPTTGRASIGTTDENGVYTLAYLLDQKGALIGEHRVTIETKLSAEKVDEYVGGGTYDKEGPVKRKREPRRRAAREELLPKKYRDYKETELTASVKKGDNTIDFDLQTE